MTRMTTPLLAGAVCWVWGVSTCFAPAPASQPAEQEALAGEIARLCRAVLDNPLDSTAGAELRELRHRQQQQRHQALDGLIKGLQAYRDGKRVGAMAGLARAVQSPYVVDLANAILPSTLAEIVEQTRRTIQPGGCPMCGQTGEADCRRCSGTGIRMCPSCKGTGDQRTKTHRGARSTGPLVVCHECNGTGAVPCPHCNGRGVVPCPKCQGKDAGDSAAGPRLAPEAGAAVEKLIGLAGYLRDGGIDLYSPKALKRSPRLSK